MRNIQYGGQIEKGDFLAIGFSNYIQFGWYIGDGQGSSLQFYGWQVPESAKKRYEEFVNTEVPSKWNIKQFENGFTLKNIQKDYIISVDSWRVCKINPIDIFTNSEDMKKYEKSKEVLIDLNFIQE